MKCKNCGAEVFGDGLFCSECGAPIDKEEENNTREEQIEVNESNINKDSVVRKSEKSGFKIGKETIIISIIALLVGAIASGIITYNVAARPVLSKMSIAEEKEADAEQLKKDAEEKYKEADEYYAKISNIKVNKKKPKKVHLQGRTKVGVDIAPGMYSMKSKTGDYCSAYRYVVGESTKNMGDLIANGYGKGELGQVILKAGEIVMIGDGIITFTPIND